MRLRQRDEKYLNFFEKFRNSPYHPKIAMLSLVLSEVINRYIREVSYNMFLKKRGISKPTADTFKNVYRSSLEYQKDYNSLCEDIKSYQNYFVLQSDGLQEEVKQRDILREPPLKLDFNDLYYYQLAKSRQYTIVTDDGDFLVEDVEIITANGNLIKNASTI